MHDQDDLANYFRTLNDDELIRKCSPGRLTEEARSVAEAEIRSRGLPLPAAEPESAEETAEEEAAYYGDYTNVARFLDPTEAHLLKAHLESCAIPAIVADANLVQTNPFLGGAVGGASVRVPAAFVSEALELIAKFKNGEFQVEEASGEPSGVEPENPGNPAAKGRRLKTYRVYSRADQAVPIVVKVGFSWAAFIFGPLWFLFNSMWLNFIIVAGLYVGGNLYFRSHQPSTDAESLLFAGVYAAYLLIWFLIGKFANSLLAVDLEDRGYRLVATVSAQNPAYARDAAIRP